MAHPSASSAFRPDVEGLRGIAILTVVAYHCDLPWITGGFVGVDVFFVLSGYLITRLLVSEIERSGRLNVFEFYARRVRRLLPASALTLLVTLAAGSFLFAPGELEFAARAGRAASIYLSNIFFAINAADYFAPRVELNPLVHMWSLAVEEQFYLFWPLLIAAGLLWVRSRRALITAIAIVTACSFAACIWMTAQNATTAFYQLPTRAWEFGAGGLLTLVLSRWQPSARAGALVGWSGLVLLGLSLVLITSKSAFPGWIALAPVAATCAVLAAGATAPAAGVAAVLGTPPLLRLGGLSYSWYLWHWPFLVFAQVLFPEVSVAGKIMAALSALAVAAIVLRVVENPLRYNSWLARRPLLSIGLGGVLTVTSFACATELRTFSDALGQRPDMKRYADASTDDGRVPRKRCVATGGQSNLVSCEFGVKNAATRVVLFGDSHAIHWFNPLESLAQKRQWTLTTLLKSGCGAANLEAGLPARDRQQLSCRAWRQQALAAIVRAKPDLVILGTATNRTAVDRAQWRQRVHDGTRATLQPLVANGLQVVVMRDVPRFRFDVPDCLARAARHGWDFRSWCKGSQDSNVNSDVYAAELEAAGSLRNVHFVDTLSALCGHGACETVSASGVVMYRDDNHLTGAFAATLEPLLERQLGDVMGGP